ncbi:MAG: toast rack family protein [Anaerolineae bacterium]|nr:toast rack family protein [Anaerolineae bacterium]MCI0607675.1 toast rack family protein [Anaerolineae bacterium]
MNGKIISAILVLALVSMACGFSIDLPPQAEAGPDVTDEIKVADPESDETRLSLNFGAGELKLSSGAEGLVEGTALYNVKELKPEVARNGGDIQIKQGDLDGLMPFEGMKNRWDLQLGKTPMDLEIDAGAYEGNMELGGLALKTLTVKDGAAHVNLSFSEPNLIEMSRLAYSTGASEVTLIGLANANFDTFDFDGGAGSYSLDFSGELQRDASVEINSGLSELILIVPEGVNATVKIEGGLTDINTGSGWSQSGTTYSHEGSGPTLTITVNMGAGTITLKE